MKILSWFWVSDWAQLGMAMMACGSAYGKGPLVHKHIQAAWSGAKAVYWLRPVSSIMRPMLGLHLPKFCVALTAFTGSQAPLRLTWSTVLDIATYHFRKGFHALDRNSMLGISGMRTCFAVDPGTTSPLSLIVAAPAPVPAAAAPVPAAAVRVPSAAAPVPAAALPCVLEEAGVEPRMLPPVSGLFDDPAAHCKNLPPVASGVFSNWNAA